MMSKLLSAIFFLVVFNSCDNNDISSVTEEKVISGTGAFIFNDFTPLDAKPINVFYHIPENTTAQSKIVMVLHGASRNAAEYRDAWIAQANQKNLIIIAPEFSDEYFPGGDTYNLGNVFEDGDHPSLQTKNNENEWTFSLIEPLFNKIKSLTNNTSLNYNIYGHSAGAQFAHRFLLFKPNANVNKVIVSAAGWYTLPDENTDFPYGLGNSFTNINLNNFFNQNITIQIGDLDNNPNSPGLRHNQTVDLQGLNRYDRAYNFYNFCMNKATEVESSFNWQIIETPNTGHEFDNGINQASSIINF